MTSVAQTPRVPGAPEWWEAKSPLGHARGMLAAGRRPEAQGLLERALERGDLNDASQRASALLSLALMAAEDGDATRAALMLDRAEAELTEGDARDHLVWWDVALARAQQASTRGAVEEAAALARSAIAWFEDAEHIVAFARPVLLGLRQHAAADGAYDAAFMVPRAIGVLELRDEYEARRWLAMQFAIRDELMTRGSLDTAAHHVAVAICAAPYDLLGVDTFWPQVTQLLAAITPEVGRTAWDEVTRAFCALEREDFSVCDYEDEAPLLPRKRTTGWW